MRAALTPPRSDAPLSCPLVDVIFSASTGAPSLPMTVNMAVCAPGEYLNSGGTTGRCAQCEAGKYKTSANTDTSCTLCPTGTSQSLTGQAQCDLCPEGRVMQQTGATTCLPCPAGFISTPSRTVCEACLPGTFTPEEAYVECPERDPGPIWTSSGIEIVGVTSIERRNPLTQGNNTCDDATKISRCVLCNPGLVQPNNGSTGCNLCSQQPVSYTVYGQSTCTTCHEGANCSLITQGHGNEFLGSKAGWWSCRSTVWKTASSSSFWAAAAPVRRAPRAMPPPPRPPSPPSSF